MKEVVDLVFDFVDNPTRDRYLNIRATIMSEFFKLEREFDAECEKNVMDKSITKISLLADQMTEIRDRVRDMDQMAKDFGVYAG
nr:MAG TPA: hypothetical protein [Caudoviricetes sp.]